MYHIVYGYFDIPHVGGGAILGSVVFQQYTTFCRRFTNAVLFRDPYLNQQGVASMQATRKLDPHPSLSQSGERARGRHLPKQLVSASDPTAS